MAGLLTVVESNHITRLQRYVEAACLVPGENAITEPKSVKNLAMAVRKFAEAGARTEVVDTVKDLRKSFEGTSWEPGVNARCDALIKHWTFQPKTKEH